MQKELDIADQAPPWGTCVRWGPSPTSCLSQDGPLTRPLSPLALLWRGPATVTAAEAEEGGRPGHSCGRREARAGAVVSDQLCLPPWGQGDSSVGGRSPHLWLPGLLRSDKGVQPPRPRWKPHSLLSRGLPVSQVSGCVRHELMYHLWGVRGGER